MPRPLPHERLVVYQKAAALYEPVRRLVRSVGPPHAHLADQLLRSVASIPLNIAEDATEFRPGDKRRFYRMALRSAGESAASIDLLQRSWLVDASASETIAAHLADVTTMLIGLTKSTSPHP